MKASLPRFRHTPVTLCSSETNKGIIEISRAVFRHLDNPKIQSTYPDQVFYSVRCCGMSTTRLQRRSHWECARRDKVSVRPEFALTAGCAGPTIRTQSNRRRHASIFGTCAGCPGRRQTRGRDRPSGYRHHPREKLSRLLKKEFEPASWRKLFRF